MIGRWPYSCLQAIGIELGLLLADARVLARALGLDQRQRLAVIAAQHVIDKTFAGNIRHAGDTNFGRIGRRRIEAGFAQQQVDEQIAGLGLAIIVRIGGGLVGGLDGRDLALQRSDLGFERGAAFLADLARKFGRLARLDRLLEAAADLLQLRQRLRRHLGKTRQRLDAERGIRRGLRAARIIAREPIGDVEEFAQAGRGLGGGNCLAVRGSVAGVLDEARLDRKRAPDQRLERGLGEMGGERRLVGVLQRPVMPVQPLDRGLQRQPAVERGGARIGMGEIFRPRGVGEDVGEFGLQKGELRHRQVSPSLTPPTRGLPDARRSSSAAPG